jgi:hypothetical protein
VALCAKACCIGGKNIENLALAYDDLPAIADYAGAAFQPVSGSRPQEVDFKLYGQNLYALRHQGKGRIACRVVCHCSQKPGMDKAVLLAVMLLYIYVRAEAARQNLACLYAAKGNKTLSKIPLQKIHALFIKLLRHNLNP